MKLRILLAVVLTCLSVPAQNALPKGVTKVTSVEGITEYQLANGLRLLVFPDSSKPTITVNMAYMVGSRHEGAGDGGMARGRMAAPTSIAQIITRRSRGRTRT